MHVDRSLFEAIAGNNWDLSFLPSLVLCNPLCLQMVFKDVLTLFKGHPIGGKHFA
jgi:hypothetical protein